MLESEEEKFEEKQKRDRLLMFVCFLTGALIGYFLTNQMALLGV